jgi:hypothetical protein
MGATSNETKQHWNADHYTQVKVSVPPELAAAFKAKCAVAGVSMASEISRFMLEYINKRSLSKSPINPFETRPQRRKAFNVIIEQLRAIMDAEQAYLDNIPENLQNSRFYDAAETSISALDEALDILSDAY